MKQGTLNKLFRKKTTNNDIFANVFDACKPFLNEDTELSLELSNETAPPKMSNFKEN